MKKNLLFVLLPFFIVQAVANPVNRESALQKAKTFFLQKGKQLQSQPAMSPRRAGADLQEAPLFYVFNTERMDGFVIVSGDDSTDDILAWSDEGALDVSNLPDNVRAWLDGYARQLELVKAGKGMPIRRAIPIHENVAEKLTTSWGQNGPFNSLCPWDGGSRSVTGCVATALAQVMNYHKWPQDSTGVIPAYTTSSKGIQMAALDSVVFDWANMKNTYDYNSTQDERNAVATLMLYCGQAVKMDYSRSGSGSSFAFAVDPLKDYFGYDKDMVFLSADDYGMAEWEEMVYHELTENGPVAYGGLSTADDAHAFVVDGYEDGLYHVNWGWDGRANGNFRLFILDPPELGTGGGSSTEGYRYNQSALFNFKKDNNVTDSVYIRTLPSLVEAGERVLVSGQNAIFQFANKSTQTEKYDVALAISQDSRFTVLSSSSDNYSSGSIIYQRGWNLNSIINSNSVKLLLNSAGYCQLTLFSKLPSSSTWLPVYDRDTYLLLTRSNGKISATAHCSNPLDAIDVVATDFTVTERLMKGDFATVNFKVGQGTKDFKRDVYVFVNTTADLYTQEQKKFMALVAGEEESLSASFRTTRAGEHTVLVSADEYGTKILGRYTFMVHEVANMMYEKVVSATTDSTAWFRLTLRNGGQTNYDRQLIAKLCSQEDTVVVEKALDLKEGNTESYEFEFAELKKNTSYNAEFYFIPHPFTSEEKKITSLKVVTDNLYEIVKVGNINCSFKGRQQAHVSVKLQNLSRSPYTRSLIAKLVNLATQEVTDSQKFDVVLASDSIVQLDVDFNDLKFATKYNVLFSAQSDPDSETEHEICKRNLMLQNDLVISNFHLKEPIQRNEDGEFLVTVTSPEQGYSGMVCASFKHNYYSSKQEKTAELTLSAGESKELSFSVRPYYEGVWVVDFTNGETDEDLLQGVGSECLMSVGAMPLDAAFVDVEGIKRLSYEQTVKVDVVAQKSFYNDIYLYYGNGSFANKTLVNSKRLNISTGDTVRVEFVVPTDWEVPGDYHLWLMCKNPSYSQTSYNLLCADTTITFAAKPADYELAMDGELSYACNDSTVVLMLMVKNNGSSAYEDSLYVEIDNDEEHQLAFDIEPIPVGESRQVSLKLGRLIESSHNVKVLYALKPDYKKNMKELVNRTITIDYTSGIGLISIIGDTPTYYDLNGQMISKPNKRGIYIIQTSEDRRLGHMGRKIVIR